LRIVETLIRKECIHFNEGYLDSGNKEIEGREGIGEWIKGGSQKVPEERGSLVSVLQLSRQERGRSSEVGKRLKYKTA